VGYYLTGMACLNGHKINGWCETDPHRSSAHCSQCGEATISQCPACKAPIRGYHEQEGGIVHLIQRWHLHPFCHRCGQAYPWTQRKQQALLDMIDLVDGLEFEDKEKLKESVPDLVVATPKTESALWKWKQILGKTGGAVRDAVIKKVVEYGMEGAGDVLGPLIGG